MIILIMVFALHKHHDCFIPLTLVELMLTIRME